MAKFVFDPTDLREPLERVVADVQGDVIRFSGEPRALMTNSAALAGRLLPGQSPQALVGRKVKLTADHMAVGREQIRVEFVPATKA